MDYRKYKETGQNCTHFWSGRFGVKLFDSFVLFVLVVLLVNSLVLLVDSFVLLVNSFVLLVDSFVLLVNSFVLLVD